MMQSLENAMAASAGISLRKKAPVFVLGCGRSGTTLLYHMLLSSGNFAVYRTQSSVINLLEPRFGDLSAATNKRRLLDAWYKTRLYTLSELEKGPIEERVMAECKNGGDFLRIIMEQMAGKQGVERWADTTREHRLHLHRIKETIPNALIIHIIRDGRDVAVSPDKQGYIRRLPWDKTPSVMVAGVYWEWMVNKGRRDGRDLGSRGKRTVVLVSAALRGAHRRRSGSRYAALPAPRREHFQGNIEGSGDRNSLETREGRETSPVIRRPGEWLTTRRLSWEPRLVPARRHSLCGAARTHHAQNKTSSNTARLSGQRRHTAARLCQSASCAPVAGRTLSPASEPCLGDSGGC